MSLRIMLKKLSDQKVHRGSDQLGQELETYPFGAIRSERYFVDGFEDQRSDLEFEVFVQLFVNFFRFATYPFVYRREKVIDLLIVQLSQKVICIEALQQVACKGLQHGEEMRPLVWKVL